MTTTHSDQRPAAAPAGGPATTTSILTVSEAAAAAKVSESMVYAWCGSGQLAHMRLGKGKRGMIRIDEADLLAFLDSCRKASAREKAQSAPRADRAFLPFYKQVMSEVEGKAARRRKSP